MSGPANPNPDEGEATNPPLDENGNPITDQGEATSVPLDENGNPIQDQTETLSPDMTSEPAILGETATLLPDNLEMVPPKTSAPASKDAGSGLLVVAILFLVGIFVQLESKGDKKGP